MRQTARPAGGRTKCPHRDRRHNPRRRRGVETSTQREAKALVSVLRPGRGLRPVRFGLAARNEPSPRKPHVLGHPRPTLRAQSPRRLPPPPKRGRPDVSKRRARPRTSTAGTGQNPQPWGGGDCVQNMTVAQVTGINRLSRRLEKRVSYPPHHTMGLVGHTIDRNPDQVGLRVSRAPPAPARRAEERHGDGGGEETALRHVASVGNAPRRAEAIPRRRSGRTRPLTPQ